MIESATLLAALGVLLYSVQAIVQMSSTTRLVVRVMYLVIACSSLPKPPARRWIPPRASMPSR